MDLKPSIEKVYPDGVEGPGSGSLKGQCVEFCHAIVQFPSTGNYVAQKIATVNKFGITKAKLKGDFRVGDVVIFTYGKYGHAAVINYIPAPGRVRYSESNWNDDLRVHHKREDAISNPNIYGVLRGALKIKIINQGVPMFVQAPNGTVYAEVGGKLQGIAASYAQFIAEYPGAIILPITQAQLDQAKGTFILAPAMKAAGARLLKSPKKSK